MDGSTLNGGLTATMILFNGYRIAATKDRLESIQKQTEAALQTQMLNTSSTVMQQYYNVVRQQAFLKTIEKSIEASQQRLDIVKTRQEIGVANQTDLLQSNIDLNALLQAKQNQLLIIDQAKADLLNTIVMPNTNSIIINDSITNFEDRTTNTKERENNKLYFILASLYDDLMDEHIVSQSVLNEMFLHPEKANPNSFSETVLIDTHLKLLSRVYHKEAYQRVLNNIHQAQIDSLEQLKM